MEKLIYFFYIFFEGILFFQAAVLVYIYYASRKSELLFYSFFLLLIAINFLISDPSTFGIGEDDAVLNAAWYKLVNTPLVILANFFYVLFLEGFYKTLTGNVTFFKILRMVKRVLIVALILFLLLFAMGIHSNLLFNIINFAGVIVGIWLVGIIIKQRMPYTKFMALGFILNLFGTMLSVFMLILLTQGVQHLLVSEYPFVFIKLGLLAEMFFFNIAIFKKWNAQERTLLQKDFEKELEIEKVKNSISKELHDDIGSTLSGIHMYSHIAGEQAAAGLGQHYQNSINRIQEASGEMIHRLKDMVWSVQPGRFLLSELADKIKEHAVFMAGAGKMELRFEFDKDHDPEIPTEWRHAVFMIAKEIISNAVKYSNASLLSIGLQLKNNVFNMEIADNGFGFDCQNIQKGNGLNNMQERAAETGSTLTTDSRPGKGTTISLNSKITR